MSKLRATAIFAQSAQAIMTHAITGALIVIRWRFVRRNEGLLLRRPPASL